MSVTSSMIDTASVQGYAAMERFQELLGQEEKVTSTFPAHVETADQFGKDIEAEAKRYQYPVEGFTPVASELEGSKVVFGTRMGEVKGQAETINAFAEKVAAECKDMSVVTPPSARTFANAEKIDPQLASLLQKAFNGVTENNKQLLAWETALVALQQQMTTHIATAEKWMPTFCDIVTNKGDPLSYLQWTRWTSVAAPAESATGTDSALVVDPDGILVKKD
ncbi:MAG: hypothetical protein K940chlam2_00440 [Chlamydiae bacterium]|nr:hypothetical protein [Chlamydiota bacterium]